MIRRITETKLPKTLYKYRDWSNRFHRRLISNQELYFAKPSDFNDPFDGNIPIRWDLMTEEDCFNKNLELLNTVHKDKNQKQVREYAWKVTKEKTMWHPDKLNKETIEQIYAAIETLPCKCKLAFTLAKINGLKYREIAEVLGITEKTVNNHLVLAVKKITELLNVSKKPNAKNSPLKRASLFLY